MAVKAMTLVGLDVHARQTHAAIVDPVTGEVRVNRLRMAPIEVVSFLDGLGSGIVAVYEAGPTGFGLARVGRERGIDVRVVAPGSIPKGPGDRVKTDRRDAVRLDARAGSARLLARRDDRSPALLSRHPDALGGRRLRRARQLRALPAADAGLGVPRDRPVRAHLRHQAPAGVDHQGRVRARAPAARRSRPALPQASGDQPDARAPPARPGPARDRDRLARAAAVHQRWQHLHTERRKPAGVVAIAVARELAGFLWEAATLD
jgi:hypothetical protein